MSVGTTIVIDFSGTVGDSENDKIGMKIEWRID